jgi:DNA-binding CsgD family transcriptional regulator
VILSVVPIAEGDGGVPRYAAAHVAPVEPERAASDKLSRREREVAKLLVEGYSNVNIAALCGLSPNTVRTFMRRLYAKLGVFNRADLVRQLVRRPLA